MVVKTSQWPQYEAFKITDLEKFEQESLLRDLRIKRIEWTCIDTITTMRFSFNNGTTSIQFGTRVKLSESFTIPKDIEIKKIMVSVRGDDEFLDAMKFFD